MVVGINSNLAASSATANLSRSNSVVSDSISRLSSGNRIIKASDDAAGLAIGTSLSTTVTTLEISKLNTEQGTAVLAIADGALSQLNEILARQKALATQSNSGSISDTERGFINQEFTALTAEIGRIVDNTNFNGINLLDGTIGQITVPGTSADVDTAAFAAGASAYTVSGSTVATALFTTAVGLGTPNLTNLNESGFQGNFGTFNVVDQGTEGGNATLILSTEIDGTTYVSNQLSENGGGDFAAATITFTGSGAASGSSFTVATADDIAAAFGDGAEATAFAAQLTTALGSLNVAQNRDVGGLTAPTTGALAGIAADAATLSSNNINTTDNSFGSIGNFTVTAGSDTANRISVTINGTTFNASDIGGANDELAAADSNIVLTGRDALGDTTGETLTIDLTGLTGTVDLTDETAAASLATALDSFFGVSSDVTTGSGLEFQVGSTVTDTISVSISSAQTTDLYKNDAGDSVTLSVDTQANAQIAVDVLDNAISNVVSSRADVGAITSRFNFAAANIEVSITNQDNARGSFLDADIAKESTSFATAQVKLQASVSVLAQANQLPQNLLQLLQ